MRVGKLTFLIITNGSIGIIFGVNTAGFVYAITHHAATYANAYIGSRLCFKNYKIAKYARETFKSLYEEFIFIK